MAPVINPGRGSKDLCLRRSESGSCAFILRHRLEKSSGDFLKTNCSLCFCSQFQIPPPCKQSSSKERSELVFNRWFKLLKEHEGWGECWARDRQEKNTRQSRHKEEEEGYGGDTILMEIVTGDFGSEWDAFI